MEKAFRYSPSNGRLLPLRMRRHFTRKSYGLLLGCVAWRYNPWTGAKRDSRDVGADPLGALIVPPDEQLRQA